MTVSDSDSDAISGIYRHSFIDNNDKNKCKKKWAAEPRKVRQPCQPKNDTYETLCVTLNQKNMR